MNEGTGSAYSRRKESRRYAQYEERIHSLKAALDTLWHRRLVIAVIAVIIAGIICGLLAVMGTFFGSFTCGDFIYGDTPPGNAKAFLSHVRYEFASQREGALWSTDVPAELGEFRIRGVSRNGFGKNRYSEEVSVHILARDLEITIADGRFTYGDFGRQIVEDNTSVTGLAEGDRVASIEYAFIGDEAGNYTVSVEQLRIENPKGQDVTGCYRVMTTNGFFTMERRVVDIRSENAEKIYDGLVWEDGTVTIVSGSLAQGDKLQTDFDPLGPDADTYSLVPNCRVLNADGVDVTDCYDIRVRVGSLTIRKRPIHITTGSAEKEYDGLDLINDQWQITSGSVLAGHTMQVEVTGKQRAAGIGKNTVSMTVLDENGNDVTHNYELTVACGKLTVRPIILTFETDSAEKMYDGTPLVAEGWRFLEGDLLPGHTMTAFTTGNRVLAGSSLNNLTVMVRDKKGNLVTGEGYQIVVKQGTLVVTKRPITIRSGSAEKLYDGSPLTCHSFTIIEGSLAPMAGITPNYTGSRTAVGTSDNRFTVTLYDNSGNNVTGSYLITYQYGTLTVLENPDYQDPNRGENGDGSGNGAGDSPGNGTTSGTGDPTENGQGHGIGGHDSGISIVFPDEPTGLVYATVSGIRGFPSGSSVYFRDSSYGDYTGRGWKAPVPDNTFYNGTLNPALIYIGRALSNANKNDARLKINLKSYCPALLPYFTDNYNPIMGKVTDCYIEDGTSSYTLALYPNYAYKDLLDMTVSVFDKEEEEIYRKVVYDRYLQIPESTKEALLLWAREKGIRAESPNLVQEIQNAIRNAAVYNLNGADYPKGVDVAVYFLTEAKEGICQHFATAGTLLYRAFGIPARYTVGFVGTVKNYTTTELTDGNAHAWVEIYLDGLGWVPIEVTAGGFGGLGEGFGSEDTIQTDLVLRAFGAEKYYDGKPFAEKDLANCYVLTGALRKGHRMEVSVAWDKSATKPGVYANRIEKCRIYDENGKNVTDQYNLVLEEGVMVIHKRPITITIGSATKTYDGLPLECDDYWISSGSLLPNHILQIRVNGSITEPGTVENGMDSLEIYSVGSSGNYNLAYCYEITLVGGLLTVFPED